MRLDSCHRFRQGLNRCLGWFWLSEPVSEQQRFVDLETGEEVKVNPNDVREKYIEETKKRIAELTGELAHEERLALEDKTQDTSLEPEI